jgi:DUF1680 family protein
LFFPLLAAFVKNAVGLSSTLSKEQDFVAIPCYVWAHRGKVEMTVWPTGFAKGG